MKQHYPNWRINYTIKKYSRILSKTYILMIIVNIKDGLGNQMFQYVTAYAKSLKLNTKVLCDCRSLNEKLFNPPPNYVKREFDLDVFGIYPSKFNIFELLITFQFLKKYSYRFFLSKILDKISPLNFLERSRKN